ATSRLYALPALSVTDASVSLLRPFEPTTTTVSSKATPVPVIASVSVLPVSTTLFVATALTSAGIGAAPAAGASTSDAPAARKARVVTAVSPVPARGHVAPLSKRSGSTGRRRPESPPVRLADG